MSVAKRDAHVQHRPANATPAKNIETVTLARAEDLLRSWCNSSSRAVQKP